MKVKFWMQIVGASYHYIIHFDKSLKTLWVEIQEAIYQKDGSIKWETIWEGTHADMMEKYGRGANDE